MKIQSMLWLVLLAAGCALKPIDPWRRGAWALERHDLDAALGAFTEVPLQHVRYPESRAAALAVQRTMRHCDELLRDALQLRSEGRDAEALAVLQRANELWPGAPGLDELIAATRHRHRLVATEPTLAAVSVAAPVAPVAPVAADPVAVSPVPEPSAAATAALAEPAAPSPEPVAAPQPPEAPVAEPVAPAVVQAPVEVQPSEPVAEPAPVVPAPEPAIAVARQPATGGDAVTAALVAVEGRLVRGDREAAITELLALARQYPDDMRVRVRASRLLHQRALVRYGEGVLDGAVADWRRVLELDPGHATASTLLRAAEREALQARGGSLVLDRSR